MNSLFYFTCHRQQVKSRHWTLSLRCCKQSQIEHIMGMYIISCLDSMLLDPCLLTAVDIYSCLQETHPNQQPTDYAVFTGVIQQVEHEASFQRATSWFIVHDSRLGSKGCAVVRALASHPGFYLGYLRGRSFPPKIPGFPPSKKILLSLPVYK